MASRTTVKVAGAALAACALAARAAAQGPADTLVYNLAVREPWSRLAVEARYVGPDVPSLFLSAPAAATGTSVTGFGASDDRGGPLPFQHNGDSYVITGARGGPIRFRYEVAFTDSVSSASTASGLDSTRLYAVTRSLFVAPDPVLSRKTGRGYPAVRVVFLLPQGWELVSGWDSLGGALAPRSAEDLLENAVAAAPDYRFHAGTVGGATFLVAVRGRRAFTDSALVEVIGQSLRRGAEAFGPVPVPRVLYISDAGRKGRTSGSLQGLRTIGLLWEPGEMLERARSHDTFHETLHLWLGGEMEGERWWIEGATDYFAARLYAEWRGDPQDLAALCYESLRNYERIPHRTTMTMAREARTMPGGDNTVRLVYRKGMLAALLLDAAIRRGSHGRADLDSVARGLLAVARPRPTRLVSEAEIGAAVAEAGGAPARREWERVVTGTGPITSRQVWAALKAVTGADLPPPAARDNVAKALARPSAP